MRKNEVYFNDKQIEFLNARQKIRSLVWGRGTGKSTAIAGITRQRLSALPRAKGFFSSTTYNQILTKTLPPIEAKLNEMGIREHLPERPGHYVVGRQPPKKWVRPISPPRKYSNILSFFNGLAIEFLSMDRPDLARGGSFDFGDIDEAALIAGEHFRKVLLPSLRGNLHRFTSHLHHNVNLYTSMPWKSSGYWVTEYEQKADTYPDEYFYSEATAFDNIDVLGKDGIKRLERELSYLEYQVEVLNRRVTRVEDCFYSKFDDTIHIYQPKYDYGEGERGIEVRGVKDIDPDSLVDVSFDFGGWFSPAVLYQEAKGVERALRQYYVKEDRDINDLVDNICADLKGHNFKYVRVWGEPRGHDKSPVGKTIYEMIKDRFLKNGWDCEVRAHAGRTTNHIERHGFMNSILAEDNPLLPKLRINQEHCKDLIIAIQMTEITGDFKKNKAKEKDRSYPQEHAPHFTDQLDYYLIQKYGHRLNDYGVSGANEAGIY